MRLRPSRIKARRPLALAPRSCAAPATHPTPLSLSERVQHMGGLSTAHLCSCGGLADIMAPVTSWTPSRPPSRPPSRFSMNEDRLVSGSDLAHRKKKKSPSKLFFPSSIFWSQEFFPRGLGMEQIAPECHICMD